MNLFETGDNMKQIEITTYVNNTIDEVDKILKDQGFKIIRKTKLRDKYFTLRYNELRNDNILEVLSSCVLLRNIVCNDIVYKTLVYKNKTFHDDTVLTEEKIEVHIEEIDELERLLEKIEFKNLVNVNNDMVVYSNGDIEFGIQQVEGLGLLLEYENPSDFSSSLSDDEIIKKKEEMLKVVRQYNLNVSNYYDVKKAYELIKIKYNSD